MENLGIVGTNDSRLMLKIRLISACAFLLLIIVSLFATNYGHILISQFINPIPESLASEIRASAGFQLLVLVASALFCLLAVYFLFKKLRETK